MKDKDYVCDCDAIHKDLVDMILENIANEELIDKLTTFYKVIGDKTRCKILFILKQHEMCVCDIAYTLGMSKSLISHQLKLLKDKRIVKYRKVGKEVYYTLDDNHIREVFDIRLKHIGEIE